MAFAGRQRGMLLVISGPSGVGKGTLAARLLRDDPFFTFSVSVTTRAPRPTERDGREYSFISEAEYDRLLAENALLEHATVHAHRYGTPRAPVERAIEDARGMLLDIDPQGALQVMASLPECVSVFVMPPSWAELRRRLTERHTEAPEDVARRLRNARGEVALAGMYRYTIVNDRLSDAYAELRAIVAAERRNTTRFLPEVPEA